MNFLQNGASFAKLNVAGRATYMKAVLSSYDRPERDGKLGKIAHKAARLESADARLIEELIDELLEDTTAAAGARHRASACGAR